MKSLLSALMIIVASSCVDAAPPVAAKKAEPAKVGSKASAILKEEDCDEKAKKPVEIKPETISLSGNAGCSLDELQKKP